MWFMHAMEYYSAFPNNETLWYATTWLSLEDSYAKGKMPLMKDYILYDSIYMTCSEKSSSVETEDEWLCRAGG